MNDPPTESLRISDSDRFNLMQALGVAAAEGRLSPDELVSRTDDAYRATTYADLIPTVADLPDADLPGALARLAGRPRPGSRIGGRPGSRLSVSVLANVDRTGDWVLPRWHVSFAYAGQITIDLRSARFAVPHCTISTLSVLSEIRILVPEDITTTIAGVSIMGSFSGDSTEGPEGGPSLHVTGLGLWGNVVVVRD